MLPVVTGAVVPPSLPLYPEASYILPAGATTSSGQRLVSDDPEFSPSTVRSTDDFSALASVVPSTAVPRCAVHLESAIAAPGLVWRDTNAERKRTD